MQNEPMANRRWRALKLILTTGLAFLFLGILLCGLQAATPALADSGTLYVDGATGSDDSNCIDSESPCATIGYAITQAKKGDEILVAEGTYTETPDILISVTLRGGYTPNGTTWLLGNGETIIDGNGIDGPVVDILPGTNVTVEGFTVQGANHVSDYGGGFYLNGATVVISDTVIRDNAVGGSGGGIFIEDSLKSGNVSLFLINSTLTGNSSNGAAAGLQVQGTDPIHVMIKDTVFTGNTGGSVVNLHTQTFDVEGMQVTSNTLTGQWAVEVGGSGTISATEIISHGSSALIVHRGSTLSAQDLTIQHNTGGGIVNHGVMTLTHSLVENNSGGDTALITSEYEEDPGTVRMLLDGCTIRENSDVYGILGFGGYALVRDTLIVGNDTEAVNGDIINNYLDAIQVELINVLFADNNAARPIVNGNTQTGTISLMNVTLAGNSVANNPILAGDGVWSVTNTILWGNTAPGDMMGLGTFTVNYSDIEGGWPGTGNLDTDPLYVDAANGDYSIKGSSRCVDGGTPSGAPTHDIEGTPRDSAPDMGAYEWVGFRLYLPLIISNAP
jgi:hypothetical protein